MDELIQKYVDALYKTNDVEIYDSLIVKLKQEISQGHYGMDMQKAVQSKSKYITNKLELS